MNKTVLASFLMVFSVNTFALECGFNSDWDVMQNYSANGQGLASQATSVRLDYRQHNSGAGFYAIYMNDGVGERFLCATDRLSDARNGIMGPASVGSYPQVSCVFNHHEGLKEFTAILVKDGAQAEQRCARDFFDAKAENALFDGQAQNMSGSCYSPQQCLIYWRIDSLDYTINEGDGQGTGSNDGGNGPA